MIASLGRDIKPLALVSFVLVLQLEWDVKEPVTLFEKSRDVGSDVKVYLTCAVNRLGGRGVIKTGRLKWLKECRPLHADVRSHLSGSSSTS